MFVKICGVTRPGDARLAAALGASAVGMVFWPGSCRAVSVECARRIVSELPDDIMAVGVFVDEPLTSVRGIVERVGLSAAQLHGATAADDWADMPVPVIRAVTVETAQDACQACEFDPGKTLLVDTFDPAQRGGTGRVGNWAAAAVVAARRRILLAGGLHHGNVAAAVEAVAPYGVDVSSGVESSPGIKDARRMELFFEAVKTTSGRGRGTRA